MKRRDAIAAIGGVGLVGVGAYYATDLVGSPDETAIDPITLDSIDAPGSSAGEIRIPSPDSPMLVTFFATWCDVCSRSMPAMVSAHDRLGSDVAFVSVTNEAIGMAIEREDVRQWWVEHDGEWPVALDPDLALTDELDVVAVPTSILLDEDGVVRWRERGEKTTAELVEA
ncbi:MAG: TlpA family protein disulfide reductase, partial [Natronomonas sp.]